MTRSTLISGTLLTNNCTAPRNHAIDTITPHYMAWYTTAKTCCESFVPASRRASANYCIGYDGEIWLNVEEQNRAWTSGSGANDNRAITIECTNFTQAPNVGVLPTATWQSLMDLCVDICKRYGKTELVYTGKASWDSLQPHQMLLTKHKWFQDTDCPGPWLDKQFGRLSNEVNHRLGTGEEEIMWFTYHIDGDKGKPMQFCDGTRVRGIKSQDELAELRSVYEILTGKSLPHLTSVNEHFATLMNR